MNESTISGHVRDALAGRDDLVAAYLFGSTATGTAHAFSDVDIAVLLTAGLSEEEMFARGLEIGTQLEAALRPEGVAVDVVVLNRAAPTLAFQVLKNGRLVLDRDPDARSLFVMRALGRYYDGKRYRDYHMARLVARIREEGLGRGYHGHRNALTEARRLSAKLAADAGRSAG